MALAILALVGVAGTAGALYYVEAQLGALQVKFDTQRQQTDEAFAKHVTALQELHRAQEDVRKLATAGKAAQPAAPKGTSADEEGEDKKKRRRKEAKEAKARARAKAKDEDEDEEKDESTATGKGKKDEEGEDEQKDEVRPRHWAGVAVSPVPL